MKRMGIHTILFGFCLLMVSAAMAQAPSFENEVLPIFEANCVGCHGGEQPKAGLNLQTFDSLLKGSKNGAVIQAGQPEKSRLLQLVTAQAKPHMPPDPLVPLSEKEIETLRQWIAQSPDARTGQLAQPSEPEKPDSKEPAPSTGKAAQKPIPEHESELYDQALNTSPPEAKTPPQNAIAFEQEIQPIFNNNCVGCHGSSDPAAGLVLLSFDDLMRGSNNGAVILPGDTEKSQLLTLVSGEGAMKMPPDPLPALPEEQVKKLKQWIAAGATKTPQSKEEPAETAQTQPAQPSSKQPASQPAEKPDIEWNADGHPSGPVAAIAFHPQKPIVAVGRLRTVELFSIDAESKRLKPQVVLPGHSQIVRGLAFSPNGKLLAAAGGDPSVQGEVMVWQLETQQPLYRIKGHTDSIYDVAFSPDGRTLATCSYDRLAKIWDAETGSEINTLKDHVDAVYDLAFSPDGSRLATVAADRTVKIWDPVAGKRLYTLSGAEGALHTVAFHPTKDHIAAAGADQMIRLWQLGETKGQLVYAKFAHQGTILNLVYTPNGERLITTAEDRLIKVWDTTDLIESQVLPKQPDWVNALAVSPGGQWIAAGRYDGSSAVYQTENGSLIASTPSDSSQLSSSLAQADYASPHNEPSEKTEPGNDEAKDAKPEEAEEGSEKDEPEVVNDNRFLVDVVKGNGTYLSSLQWLSPRAVTRGQTTTLKIRGKNLDDAKLLFNHPGITAEIIERELHPYEKLVRRKMNTSAEIVDTGRPQTLTVQLTVAEDVPPGIRRVRVRTPLATSNALPFAVEPWEAVSEQEANDTVEKAQAVEFPAILAGKIDSYDDQDHYRFQAEAGDEWVFDTVANAIGFGFDAVLEVLNSQGELLASSENYSQSSQGGETRIGVRIEESGEYLLRVREKNLERGSQYRIHATQRPWITGIFPLGAQKGESTSIQVQGFNLKGKTAQNVTIPEGHTGRRYQFTYRSEQGEAINSWDIAVGRYPEIVEQEANNSIDHAMAVQPPVTVNGRIYHANEGGEDLDYFKFSAQKNRPLVIEVEAQQYGSPLDSIIEIVHADGSPIEIATVRCEAETFVTLSDRDSRTSGIRLDSWNELAINDYVMIGSEIIQVAKLPDYPDEDVRFKNNALRGWRYTYFGTTPGYHAVNDPAYKVSIHPPGKQFSPNGMPVFRLDAENDDGGAPFHDRDSYFVFTPPQDGDYVVKLRDSFGHGGFDYAYRLSLHSPRPDYQIHVDAGRPIIPAGGGFPIRVKVSRLDGFDQPVDVEVQGLPDGIHATSATVLADEEEVSLILQADEEAQSTPPDSMFTVVARATINGKTVVREETFGAITVTQNPDVKVWQEPKAIELIAGETAAVQLRVKRFNGFSGRVPIDVRNLPLGVYVMDTGLNGIMVKEGEDTRTMIIYAEPWVRDMTLPLFSIANVETRSPIPNRNVSEISTLRIRAREQLAQN